MKVLATGAMTMPAYDRLKKTKAPDEFSSGAFV
jgi:hypothetical protein